MSQRIIQQQLESYLWGAATLLRGTIDAGDYKQFIFPLLFYKRLCDVFDEETQAALKESSGDKDFAAYPENHRFQIPAEAHWRNVRQAAKNVGNKLQTAMRAIETANPSKLFGIFGDAQWTNKDRLSDAMLRDLVEHFSNLDLSVANLPEDELGQGYEYLIKKFADDSGHTAAEFYTNRTVVHLMTEMLRPQPSESIYDPTCGSGGMLLSCITHLRRQGQEWRNVRLYGQERNLMTSSIARMNCFLHGIEDFQIVRGDTLSEPKFVQRDHLMRFDLVLANPPYSIKQWDRDAFASDPWGRNLYGTPPQGRADYAFWQHILCSLAPKAGRCAILFPHGVLFRQEEAEMRRKLIETDTIDCVLGLGPNLFYNSPMEACVVICRTAKPKARKGRILLIDAVNEVTRERAQSFLTDDHIQHIAKAYEKFKDEPGFARVVTLEEIRAKDGNLSIPLYVEPSTVNGPSEVKQNGTLAATLSDWLESRHQVTEALTLVLPKLAKSTIDSRVYGSSSFEPLKHQAEWTRVCFGDVVENVNETESKPAEAGLERFIGLEHIEPGSLHVRTWGDVADGTTFTRRCRLGQVLFGKRRAYQRKVAVAEFDAVVSGDIYVLAPKKNHLVPELLPFICLSERFFRHAVGTSAGSLSPRTNWSSLANFEFDLPPLDQQRRIADILWSVDECTRDWLETASAATRQRESIVRDFVASHTSDIAVLGDYLEEVQYGSSNKAILQPAPGLWPLLRIPNVIGGNINFGELQWLEPKEEFEKYRLKSGDILIVRTNGNPDYVGRTAVYESALFSECLFASYLIRLRPKSEKLLSRFLHEMLQSSSLRKEIRKQVKSSAGNYNLNTEGIRGLRIPVPTLDVQRDLLACLASSDASVEGTNQRVARTRSLQSALLSKVF